MHSVIYVEQCTIEILEDYTGVAPLEKHSPYIFTWGKKMNF